MPYIAGPTTPAPVAAQVARLRTERVQLGHYRYDSYDDRGDYMGGDDDELGFSFNPLKIVSNVAKAVTKGVKDVAAEAGRAAKNPLVQGVASFVPGGGLITKGIGIANSIGGSRIATAAATVDRLTSGQTSVKGVGSRIIAEQQAAATKAAADAAAAAAKDARAAQRAEAARKKAEEGARIQAENARKAEEAAAAAKVAADKKAADQATRREAKAAEGKRIQEENARKREAAQLKAKEKAAESERLQREALDAAKAGNEQLAAQLREQAAAATSAARSVSSGAPVADTFTAGGQAYAAAPAADVTAGGSGPLGMSSTALALTGLAVAGGLYAVTRGGGSHKSWR